MHTWFTGNGAAVQKPEDPLEVWQNDRAARVVFALSANYINESEPCVMCGWVHEEPLAHVSDQMM